uniref:ATP synthase subunit s, mitochondrial n=1 Tax=Microcebus murinus TaxID=30608 RepID=A0A8C6ELM2_MICMU
LLAGHGGSACNPSTLGGRVDYERIKDVGPDRAASEWLSRCSLDKYKIQAIDATDTCIMNIEFDHMDDLEHAEKMRLCKCHYIEDDCLQKIGQLEKLQKSLLEMEIISCGNITDKGIIALSNLRNLKYLLLSDLPGVKEKENLVQAFKTALSAASTLGIKKEEEPGSLMAFT